MADEASVVDCVMKGANLDDALPDDQCGKLDVNMLKKMGLNAKKMQPCDILFFIQLQLPICHIFKSSNHNDCHLPFFLKFVNGQICMLLDQIVIGVALNATNLIQLQRMS